MEWELTNPQDNNEIFKFDEDENKEFIGQYVGKKENLGDNNSTLYTFKDEEGKIWDMWGTTLLDSRLSTAKTDEWFKFVYLGKAKSKNGRTFHNFEVYHSKAE